jgi:hypothetical protein
MVFNKIAMLVVLFSILVPNFAVADCSCAPGVTRCGPPCRGPEGKRSDLDCEYGWCACCADQFFAPVLPLNVTMAPLIPKNDNFGIEHLPKISSRLKDCQKYTPIP